MIAYSAYKAIKDHNKKKHSENHSDPQAVDQQIHEAPAPAYQQNLQAQPQQVQEPRYQPKQCVLPIVAAPKPEC